jgi:hypothetical protein
MHSSVHHGEGRGHPGTKTHSRIDGSGVPRSGLLEEAHEGALHLAVAALLGGRLRAARAVNTHAASHAHTREQDGPHL